MKASFFKREDHSVYLLGLSLGIALAMPAMSTPAQTNAPPVPPPAVTIDPPAALRLFQRTWPGCGDRAEREETR